MPPLIWNMMMSMSGRLVLRGRLGGDQRRHTPPRRCRASAPTSRSPSSSATAAIGWAIVTMLVVILIYDQLLFRPLVAWADGSLRAGGRRPPPRSWALDLMRRSRLVAADHGTCFTRAVRWTSWAMRDRPSRAPRGRRDGALRVDWLWTALIAALVALGARGRSARLRRWRRDSARSPTVARLALSHPAAGGRADRAREPHLGADRRVGRHAAARGDRAAGRAVPRGVSGQPAFPGRGLRRSCL